jgi:hypothetical protein
MLFERPRVLSYFVSFLCTLAGGAIEITTRMCQTRSTNYCEHLKDTIEATGAGTVEHCSYCDDDLCNAGPKSVAVSLSALMLVAATALRHLIVA